MTSDTPKQLSPDQVTSMFSKMNPAMATRYFRRCASNDKTPKANMELFRQYRSDHPEKFLSDDQMAHADGVFSRLRRYTGGYSDNGKKRSFGFSDRSIDDIGATMKGLRDNIARTRYFNKTVSNPYSNGKTVENLIEFRNANPDLFESDESLSTKGISPYAPDRSSYRTRYSSEGYRSDSRPSRSFWSRFWKSKDDFDSMPKNKQRFFAGAFKRRDRDKNCRYGLRVVTDPQASATDRKAMTEVVRENPLMFFNTERPNRPDVPAAEPARPKKTKAKN